MFRRNLPIIQVIFLATYETKEFNTLQYESNCHLNQIDVTILEQYEVVFCNHTKNIYLG